MIRKSHWLVGKPIAKPTIHLYCFPHSGGLPSEYVRWARELPGVQVYGVGLPGRGERIAEPPPTSMRDLIERFLADTELAPPFVLLGHSFGAIAAFELARELAARGLPLPERLIASAHGAPHLPRTATDLHQLPDDELTRAIEQRYGAIPPQILADPELLTLLMPAFRTDFTVLETYRYRPGSPLTVPLDAFGGVDDSVAQDALALWRDYTTAEFALHPFAGGHFYFRDDPRAFFDALRGLLAR